MKIRSEDPNADSTATKPAKKARRTPTQRQVAKLTTMTDEGIVVAALEAMHALNRRAKKVRDQRNTYRRATFARALDYEVEAIYSLKDAFLTAMVRAGRARVEVFSVTRHDGYECFSCGRTWGGSNDECFRCIASGIPIVAHDTWYVIDCGNGRRFHQPEVPRDVAAVAVAVEPHEPTQPAREIPTVGLTIEAQRECIRIAIQRLAVKS